MIEHDEHEEDIEESKIDSVDSFCELLVKFNIISIDDSLDVFYYFVER